MLELFLDFFVVFVVVVDPVGLAPIFLTLTHAETPAERRRTAAKGTLIAGAILVVFVLAGDALLRALNISVPAFQIAGGALLFLLAVDMVFARHSGLRSTTASERKEAIRKKDLSVFPLAIPLIAGPGALTTVLLMVGDHGENPLVITLVLAVVATVLLLTFAALRFSLRIQRLLGETGTNVISRVLGIVLAALAVQFVLDGVQAGLFADESFDLAAPRAITAALR